MHRQPSAASASPVGRVTLTLYGPVGELAAALRTLADALDHEQATSTVTYTATVEPHARGPAPGGMTAMLADRFVAQLTPAAADVVALLCHNARTDLRGTPGSSPSPTRHQPRPARRGADLAGGRAQAAARGRGVPDRTGQGAAALSDRAGRRRAAPGCDRPRSRRRAGHEIRFSRYVGQDLAALTLARDLRDLRLAQRSDAHSRRLPGVAKPRYNSTQAALLALVDRWRAGHVKGLEVGGVRAEEARAPARPAMTYVREQLRERLAREVSRQYLRWLHPTSRRRPGESFL